MTANQDKPPSLPQLLRGSSSSPPAGPRFGVRGGVYVSNVPRTATKTAPKAIQQYFSQYDDREASLGEEWKALPEVPSAEEVMVSSGDTIYFKENLVDCPWGSTGDYLETHYKLIREDAIAPLRDAVAHVCNTPSMDDTNDISIYEKVYITRATFTTRGVAFRIRFSTARAGKKILWQFSSRLIAGSIVALSPLSPNDRPFRNKCVVATVAARVLENVQKSPPEIDIFFANPGDVSFDPHQEWIMVEARSGYYEAYRHTMTALQKLSTEKFPLSNHICGLEPDVMPPQHIQTSPVMNFSSLAGSIGIGDRRVNVLENFPAELRESLDEYQWHALQQILTKKLAIIQGPPGTGKTFVSVVALKILLASMRPDDPPIIIASQTNHALDQLISQVFEFEKRYIRLGGRSSDTKIRKRTLYAIRNSQPDVVLSGGSWSSAKNELRKIENGIIELLRPFSTESFGGHMIAAALVSNGLLTEAQMSSLTRESTWIRCDTERGSDPFANWLGDCRVESSFNYPDAKFAEDEIDEEYEKLGQIEAGQSLESDSWEALKGRFLNLSATFSGRTSRTRSESVMEQYLRHEDLRLVEVVQQQLRPKLEGYVRCCRNARIGSWEKDHHILKVARLIAMTTTGMSKYRALLSSLNPRVVLIEEAAEAIEGHVVTACFESLQQLILVGDHQQLKAHCAVSELGEEPYHLAMSMFERLVKNNMPFTVLREQRRMAPEIRELLGQFYENLHDHDSVQGYDSVPGMGQFRSFFYCHAWPESGDSLMSRVNNIEAVMVVNFYNYLLLNQIPPEKITIVTFYNGQRKLILNLLKSGPYAEYQEPKVTTVDSYQGEENEIIILSLVRSSDNCGIGFLSSNNRICVALSRAKKGLFIFGNAVHLSQTSQAWQNIIRKMNSNKQVQDFLPVTCSKHGITTEIEGPGDWKEINGGCRKLCDEKLDCGFPHTWVKCTRECKEELHATAEALKLSDLARDKVKVPEPRYPGSQSQWKKFAEGGARESDLYFRTLALATDATSNEVKEARANLDDRLIPKHLKSPPTKEESQDTDLGGVPVGKLID
ncbi:ATP binding protein [Penicillium capsulatum]|nr:ATP binding protein [Penicillium capsulatum]